MTGWTASFSVFSSAPGPSASPRLRVIWAEALAELLTARSGRSMAFIPSDRVSQARYWLANNVSPPTGGNSRAASMAPIGGSGV